MTPEEGHRLSQFQRPGVMIVMGPEHAEERWMPPAPPDLSGDLPGDTSWFNRDLRMQIGFLPHGLAKIAGCMSMLYLGRPLTRAEWIALHDRTSEYRWEFFTKCKEGEIT